MHLLFSQDLFIIRILSCFLYNRYFDRFERCFFTKKAEAVLSVIQNILKLIVKFRTELVGEQLVENPKTGDYEHAMFELLVETYQEFKKKSLFLYKSKLRRSSFLIFLFLYTGSFIFLSLVSSSPSEDRIGGTRVSFEQSSIDTQL